MGDRNPPSQSQSNPAEEKASGPDNEDTPISENARDRAWLWLMLGVGFVVGTSVLALGVYVFAEVTLEPRTGWRAMLLAVPLRGHLVALGILVLTVFFLHLLLRYANRDRLGIASAVMGKDRRVSTSWLQITLWTLVVPFALLSILVNEGPEKLNALENLQYEYLVLLGSPAAATLLAKVLTNRKIAHRSVAKTPASQDPTLAEGLSQIVSDDRGQIDPFDLQYFLFNLLALAYFFFAFFGPTEEGGPLLLPDLPGTLVALTGASAAGYISRKALIDETPVLIGVFPSAASPGGKVWIRGNNLIVNAENADGDVGRDGPLGIKGITFGGRKADGVKKTGDNEFEARVPQEAEVGKPAPIKVTRSDGATTAELAFDVIAAP